MISRFSARRLLCCLMAALTFFGALSPALFQPADAVAVADDVLIASLGLLAMSWAGISFSSCAVAQTAVNSFLASKPAAKLSLAGLLTKGLVTEGTKLLLTGDVRDAFSAVLPEIRGFFNTESEVLSSKSSYFVGTSVAGPAYSVPIYRCVNWTDDFLSSIPPLFPSGSSCVFLTSSWWSSCFFIGPNYVQSCSKFVDGQPYGSVKTLFHFDSGLTVANVYFPASDYYHASFVYIKDGKYCTYGLGSNETKDIGISFRLVTSSDSVTYFDKSLTVDGTSALEILQPAPLYVVNPGGSSGGDGSQKPEIDFSKYGMFALEGLIGALLLTGDQAKKDPGLDPEQMVDQLKKAMESTQTEPKPEPEPQPDPDPDTPGGSSGTAPDFNGMMLPGLKDFFPFCIPFDLKKMMDALCADPVAPKFTFATSFLGQVYTVDIDLSAWDGVATTVRYMVVATYIVCLAVATRKFIKW